MRNWANKYYKNLPLIACLLCLVNARAQTFVFAELTGTPLNTSGWNLHGAARVGNTGNNTGNGELILVEPINTSSGSIFFASQINLAQCRKWIAEFDFRIADGNAADGLTFCYLDVPPVGFVNGGGLGIPGTANGLKVCIDTWRNCGTDAVPKIEIRYGAGYDECNGQPTRDNNDGKLNFIRNGNYHRCRIVYDAGQISVEINGEVLLTANQTFNFPGFFGFTASTGGFFDRHSIRNVRIFTEMPPSDAGNGVVGCPGSSHNLGTLPNPDYSYQWSPQEGLSNPNASNPTLTLPENRGVNFQQWYVVETGFKTIPGCNSRDSILVTVFPEANPNFTNDSACLPANAILFSNTTSLDNQPASPTNNAWRWTAEAVGGGPVQTSTQHSPSFNLLAGTAYQVALEATTANGCKSDTSMQVTAVFETPVLAIESTNDACAGVGISLMAKLENSGVPLTNYSWQMGDGTTLSGQNITHSYRTAGNYTVNLQGNSGNRCEAAPVSKQIAIRALPNITGISGPDSACAGDLVTLNAQSPDSDITDWQWVVPSVGNFSGNPVAVTLVSDGNQIAEVSATNAFGCKSILTKAIAVGPVPEIDAGPNRQVIAGNSVQLLGEADDGTTTLLWQPSSLLNDPGILQPVARPSATTVFTLRASNGFCEAVDTVSVFVFPELKIPNVFSPNGDGINDTWNIVGLNTYSNLQVLIFDRYGRVVFTSTQYNIPWDGKRNGQELPAGVYYYIIDLSKEFGVLKGSITLLR